jgi:CheY-like chemotaxis protein
LEARRPIDTPIRVGARVLAVDDDADVREVIVKSLCEFGYAVTAASSGGAALDKLITNRSRRSSWTSPCRE